MMGQINHSQIYLLIKRGLPPLLLIIGLVLSSVSAPLYALGSCSAYQGQAVLNEFYHSNQSLNPGQYFVEAKALDYDLASDDVTYRGWSVTLCSARALGDGAPQCISGNSALAAANANTSHDAGLSLSNASWLSGTNAWITVDQADWSNGHGYIDFDAGTGHGMEALLLDENGDLIDYLSVDGYSALIGTFESCGLTQVTYAGTNAFSIQRVPDGSGPWGLNLGNSSDETGTASNDILPPPPAGTSYPEVIITNTNVVAGDAAAISVGFNDADGDGLADTFPQTVTILYETRNGTAESPDDYSAITTNTISIPAGMGSTAVTVNTSASAEGDSYFYLYLQSVVPSIENGNELNATIGDHLGKATFIPSLTAYYAMDEGDWYGNVNEVVDSSGSGLHGTAINGLTTTPTKVCNGANLTSGSQYVNIADDNQLDFAGEHTLSAWIKPSTIPASGEQTILSKGSNYQITINSSGHVVWHWNDTLGSHSLTSTTTLAADSWAHIAIVYSSLAGNDDSQAIYINATEDSSSTTAANTVTTNSNSLQIGGGFEGLIDELRIYGAALPQTAIKGDMEVVHPCSLGSISIVAASSASSCAGLSVAITINDNSGNPITDYSGTISLSTDTGEGTWSTAPTSGTNPDAPNGSFSDPTAEDGAASYEFTTADLGTVTLYLSHPDGIISIYAAEIPEGVLDSQHNINILGDNVFVFTEDPITVAGRPQTISVQALDKNCSTVRLYRSATTDVLIWIDRNGVLEPSTPPQISSVALPSLGSTLDTGETAAPINLTFDANASASFTLNTSDVGQYSLRISDTFTTSGGGGGSERHIEGSSSRLTVPPFGFKIDFPDDRQIAMEEPEGYTKATSYAADATTGTIFTTAGSNFNMRATAVLWEIGDDTDNNGTPDSYEALYNNSVTPSFGLEPDASAVNLLFSYTLVAPSGGSDGILATEPFIAGGTYTTFSNGSSSAVTSWSEVGIITIDASLGSYLNSGKSIYGQALNVGRFIPASFTVAINSNGTFNNANITGTTPFTYLGEEFSYSSNPEISITALNSKDITTANYTGNFAFLTGDEITLTPPSADASNSLAVDSGSNFGTLSVTPVDNGDGSLLFTLSGSSIFYQKPSTELAPFMPNLPISISDINETNDSITTFTGTTSFTPTGNLQRFGRVLLSDIYGSSVAGSALPLPLTLQYYDGSGFISNDDDTGRSFDSSLIGGSNCSDPDLDDLLKCDNIAITPATIFHGEAFTLTADGNSGSLIYTLDLTTAIDANGDDMKYLMYDWDGESADIRPAASALFYPVYRGDDRFLFWKEVEEAN